MTTCATESAPRFQEIIDAHRDDLPGNHLPWLKQWRNQAVESFKCLGFPDKGHESWRYSRVDSLLSRSFQYPETDIEPFIPRDLLEMDGEFDSHRIVFLNGRYCAQLSLGDLPQGLYIGNLWQTLQRRPGLLRTIAAEHSGRTHVFNALNTALFNDGVLVHIGRGYEAEKPIEVIYLTIGGKRPYVFSPRNALVLESCAKATLIERYVGDGDVRYFNNGLSEIILREYADLTHYRMQEESREAYHLSTLSVKQEERSRYVANNIILGGVWSRTEYNVELLGEGAVNELDGIYLARDKQLADVHLHVKHNAPHCYSRQDYRGIAHGKGRAVFDAKIEVEKHAQKTRAQMSNANLVLSRGAEVDSKPQLLIYADDVKCSHGATVGQIEPEHLFYLRSRGISEPEAKRMLCLGFAGEVLERCSVSHLRQKAQQALRDAIDSEVGQVSS